VLGDIESRKTVGWEQASYSVDIARTNDVIFTATGNENLMSQSTQGGVTLTLVNENFATLHRQYRLPKASIIDIETCLECGSAVKVIACIEDPVVIKKIFTHLNHKAASVATGLLPEKFAGSEFSRQPRRGEAQGRVEQCRVPPYAGLFDCPTKNLTF
jgi:hypothetical protein